MGISNSIRFNERILEDKDCENIYELVYHSHRQVAQAAGEFLNQKLFHKAEQPLTSSKKRSQNTAFMHLLVQFFIESEVMLTALEEPNEVLRAFSSMNMRPIWLIPCGINIR